MLLEPICKEGRHDQEHPAHQLGGPWCQLGSALLSTLLLLSPFLWGAPLWHWLLAIAIALALGLYLYVRREHYEEPGADGVVPLSWTRWLCGGCW